VSSAHEAEAAHEAEKAEAAAHEAEAGLSTLASPDKSLNRPKST
jgi:hypothetical protein